MTSAPKGQTTSRPHPLARANKINAARLFVAASKKSGQPIPDYIQVIADQRAATD